MLKLKKNDRYIILAVLAAAAFLFIYQRYVATSEGAKVLVQRNGETIASYPLTGEEHLIFTDENGNKNVLIIRDKKAYMEEANCPDKLCVKQRAITKTGESIICLPHKLVVQIIGGEEGQVDAVAK